MKLCRGVLHRNPENPDGTWLPATEEYWAPKADSLSKTFWTPCRQCKHETINKNKRPAYGYVSIGRVRFVFVELQRRLGNAEASRRVYGSSSSAGKLSWVLKNQQYVEKETARKAMEELRRCRASNEVRSKYDIKRGNYLRGKKERPPQRWKDYYVVEGDEQAEQVRRKRKLPKTDEELALARKKRNERARRHRAKKKQKRAKGL